MSIFSRERIFSRLRDAYRVLLGRSLAVPVLNNHTDILVVSIEVEGSKTVSTYYLTAQVEPGDSYTDTLREIIMWVAQKNRFFWIADPLGIKIIEESTKETNHD